MLTKSETTISHILDAAAALFTAKSYADVTMDQIAEASQVTKGALYHHFSGKEALYFEMVHNDFSEKKEIFGQAIRSGGGCRDRLRHLTAAFFDLPHEKRELMQLVRRDANIFQETTREKLVRAYQGALPELIEDVIRDGIRDGEIAPADCRLLSWHFVAMVEITLSRYADDLFRDDADRLDHIIEFFFHGAAQQGENK